MTEKRPAPSWLARQGWCLDDLEANRDGRLSAAQAARIRGRMRTLVRTTALWLVALPGALLLATVALFATGRDPTWFLLPGLGLLATLPVLGLYVVGGLLVRRDVAAGSVRACTGTVRRWYVIGPSGVMHMWIGDTRLRSAGPTRDRTWIEAQRLVRAASPGRPPVCAYHLPRTHLLVAAEPAHGVPTAAAHPAPPPAGPGAAPVSAAPGWYPDPSGRHHWRWFDGVRWTAHVADGGVPAVDPLGG